MEYNDVKSAVNTYYNLWDPSTTTLMEEECGQQEVGNVAK